MENIITTSIGLGLVVSLMFSELLGIAAGGMVVPGYFALYLHKPFAILYTISISYITYFIVHSLSSVIILFGRRRTVLMILIGFCIGWLCRSIDITPLIIESDDVTVIGYIVPGLIAIWMDRQGILETVTALITSSVIVRLVLILIFGREILI